MSFGQKIQLPDNDTQKFPTSEYRYMEVDKFAGNDTRKFFEFGHDFNFFAHNIFFKEFPGIITRMLKNLWVMIPGGFAISG